MLDLKIQVTKFPPSAESLMKQFNFGTARGLTLTAQQGQTAVQARLREKFTIRNKWLEKQTPVGIKIKPATKVDLTAEIYTKAPFLPRQEEGGPKFPYKHYLAIPAKEGPLNRAKVIPKRLRPANLPNAFILTTKKGTKLLVVRKMRGKYKGLTIYYVLVPKAQIKKADIFEVPIRAIINRNLANNISEGIDNALKTAK